MRQIDRNREKHVKNPEVLKLALLLDSSVIWTINSHLCLSSMSGVSVTFNQNNSNTLFKDKRHVLFIHVSQVLA